MAQEFSRAFYNSPAWRHCRKSYLKSVGGLCEDCLAHGIYTPAKIIHHVVPLTPTNISDPKIALSYSNLCALCQACHDARHKQGFGKHGRYYVDKLGNILPR